MTLTTNLAHSKIKILLIPETTHITNQINLKLSTSIKMIIRQNSKSTSKILYMALSLLVVQILDLGEQIDQSIQYLQNTKEAKVHQLLPKIDSS